MGFVTKASKPKEKNTAFKVIKPNGVAIGTMNNVQLTQHIKDMNLHFTEEEKTALNTLMKNGIDDIKYPGNLKSNVVNGIGGFKESDSLEGMSVCKIIERLLCAGANDPRDLPTFIGLIPFKDITEITYDDLDVDTVDVVPFDTPQMKYQYKEESFTFNKSAIIAFPKSYGSITGVVDGANISIAGSYGWTERAVVIPNVGLVTYIIGGAKEALFYNKTSVVKWNIK